MLFADSSLRIKKLCLYTTYMRRDAQREGKQTERETDLMHKSMWTGYGQSQSFNQSQTECCLTGNWRIRNALQLH